MSLLAPGTRVRVTRVDPYGLQGREPHPPTGHYVRNSAEKPVPFVSGPCDNREALVVRYLGWEAGNSESFLWSQEFGWSSTDGPVSQEGLTSEIVYNAPVLRPSEYSDDLEKVHFYSLVVEGIGVFDFADYEFSV